MGNRNWCTAFNFVNSVCGLHWQASLCLPNCALSCIITIVPVTTDVSSFRLNTTTTTNVIETQYITNYIIFYLQILYELHCNRGWGKDIIIYNTRIIC